MLELKSSGAGEILMATADDSDVNKGVVCAYSVQISNKPHVQIADASSLTRLPAQFLALQDISVNTKGMFLRRGIVKNDVFSGYEGGTILYTSTTSGHVTNDPSAYTYIQQVGVALGNGWVDWDPCCVLDTGWWAPQ